MRLAQLGARNLNDPKPTRAKRLLALSSSIGALTAALVPSAGHAQTSTDDDTVTTEIVAIDGQALESGELLGGFLPVVIGGDGDLLFLSQTANNRFITFDGDLDLIAGAFPFGLQNQLDGTYSIDSLGNRFAVTTQNGIFTGFVGDTVATEIDFDAALAGFSVRDAGNLDNASPLVLNNQTALLLSDVGVNEPDGSFIGNTQNFVFLAGMNESDFEVVSSFSGVNATSLNFAGPGGLLASTSGVFSTPNSATTSNLFLIDVNDGADALPLQIGPNGNPQIVNGMFAGGDLNFAGFEFNDNTGGNFIGSGANFDRRAFSANSVNEAFVLGNALLGLDGGPGNDVPGELLIFDEQVIAVGSNFNIGTQTSVGEVAFDDFDNVILAENGDLFFTARTTQVNGQPLANEVGLWRIIDAGGPNQAIVPVVQVGDNLIVTGSGLDDLFPAGGVAEATVAGFNLANISLSQGIASDGRPNLISVNEQGNVATIVQIDSVNGPVEAIVAQDDNGDFHVVAFIGQLIDVDGQGDLRRITNFTAQFGSNDIDGAGDLFNRDEQLGFIVTLDRENTNNQEFDKAVFRVSLNGIEMVPITEFLWQGGCGDDEFFTRCILNGDNGSNWVNAQDTGEISADPPGEDPGQHSATIRGTDIRIATDDVNLARLDSDSTVTLQEGRTLTLTNGGDINRLVIERSTLNANGTLNLSQFDFGSGTRVVANDRIFVEDNLRIRGGRLEGPLGIDVELGSAIQSTAPQALLTGNIELATNLRFFDNADVTLETSTLEIEANGRLELNEGSDLSIMGANITGEGQVLVDSASSSITTQGLSFFNAPLIFLDANSAREDRSQDDLLRIVTSTLVLSDATFSAPGLTSIAPNQGAGIAIDPGATLEIDNGGSLTVQSFVEVKRTPDGMGDGASAVNFMTGSTLRVDPFGTVLLNLGENGAANFDQTTFTGGGLLENRSDLSVSNSNLSVVFSNTGTATFAGNNTIATDAAAAMRRSDDGLFAEGVEAATGTVLGSNDGLPAISALLSDVTFTGGNNQITGDGTAFLIGNELQGGRLDTTAPITIAGALALNNQAVFTSIGTADNPFDFAILATNDEQSEDPSATLTGDGFALLEFTTVKGQAVPNSDQLRFATLTNQIGAGLLGTSPALLETIAPVNLTMGGLLDISDSSIADLVIVNEGVARLDDVTLLADVPIGNAGLLSIAGAIIDNSVVNGERTSFISNVEGARLQFTGNENVDAEINNFGLITLSGANVDVTIDTLFVTDDDATVFGSQAILDQATLTINSSDALIMGENGAAAALIAIWGVEDASVNIFGQSGEVLLIDTIDANGSVEIFGTGTLNNLDANGLGLRTVNGTFIGGGGFDGGDIDIGEGGFLAFGEDSEFGDINIMTTGIIEVDGLVAFTDAVVEGGLLANRITGSRLNTDFAGFNASTTRPVVDVTSVSLGTTVPTVQVNDIEIGLLTSLLYRGLITAENIVVEGTITSDDFEASTLVERIETNTLTIGGGRVVAEELLVRDTLTIGRSGEFEQEGEAELEVNNLELDGTLTGQTILIAGDLRIGDEGFLDIADLVDVAGALRINGNGLLAADILRASDIEIDSFSSIQISRLFEVDEEITIDGTLDFAPPTVPDDDIADSILGLFSDDLNVSEGGVITGAADIEVGGSITTQSGALILIDGILVADGDIIVDGLTQTSALGAGGDINLGNDTNITGAEETGESFFQLGSGNFSGVSLEGDSIDAAELDLIAGDNLTVGPSADVNVDGSTLISVDFEIGADASFESTGFFVGLGDFTSGQGSSTTVQNSAFVDGSADFGGNISFGQTVVDEGIRLERDSETRFDNVAVREIDFSVPLDDVNESVDQLEGIAFSATFEDGVFEFNVGNFGLGTFGDLDGDAGASVTVIGNAFVGGALTNLGDAFFDGDLFTGFEQDDPGITFTNGEENSDNATQAQFDLAGNLGTVGGLQNFGDLSVSESIFTGGNTLNGGNLRFGRDFIVGGAGELQNNGSLIGGRLAEPGLEFQPYRIQAARVINRGFVGGTGTIEGDFIQEVQQDAATLPTISPGFSPGIINITGDATFNDGVVFFEIAGLTPGTEHDQINVGGNLTIGANAMIVVDLLELADGSGIFLPRTGDEIVLFTAADISPDDVEQIDFSVVDDLPVGFTLVPDITRTDDGEIFRVLRGFDGSELSLLAGLDPSQIAVAGAIDFLSSAESGVPSPELFQIAVDLQFADDFDAQLDGLSALSASTLSAIQDGAMQAGSIGQIFAESRLRGHANGIAMPVSTAQLRGNAGGPSLAIETPQSNSLTKEQVAATVARRATQGGGTEFLTGDGAILRIVGGTNYAFGDSASRGGTTGFDYDGWSANAAVELEGADGAFLLGAALSLGSIESELDESRGSVETDSLAATFYGQYNTGPVSIALGYSKADLDIESQRQVLNTSATGEVDGDIQHLFTRLSVRFVDTDMWQIGPEAQLAHSDLEIDSLAETGAGAVNLITQSLNREATRLNLSGQLAHLFKAGSWAGALELGAGYQFALSGNDFITNSVIFAVAPSTTFANPLRPLQNSGLDLNASLSLATESGINLGVAYDGLWAENGQDSHAVSFGVSAQF